MIISLLLSGWKEVEVGKMKFRFELPSSKTLQYSTYSEQVPAWEATSTEESIKICIMKVVSGATDKNRLKILRGNVQSNQVNQLSECMQASKQFYGVILGYNVHIR